jgi:UDP-N-acetylmuramate--alanine ligase
MSLDEGSRVHMMGIGGVGMAGLARLLSGRFRVSGCDLSDSVALAWLRKNGIPCRAAHDPAHLESAPDALIRSAAIPDGMPELREALARGIPVARRGEVLGALSAERPTIAVSGAHGKTTTSAMIAQALRAAGGDPSYAIGGWCRALDGPGHLGRGDWLAIEADESDGTLVHYRPSVGIILNIDYDHMEHFDGPEAFFDCFRAFANGSDILILPSDGAASAVAKRTSARLTFGTDGRADVSVIPLERGARPRCEVSIEGRSIGNLRLPVPGAHNLANAAAALAACRAARVDPMAALAGLERFQPVDRRFQRVAAGPGFVCYSDYAHHPTEIAALVCTAAAAEPGRPLAAIFQPHRYTRTQALGDRFPAAFEGAERVALLPVYAASEAPLPGGATEDLARHFAQRGRPAFETMDGLESGWEWMSRWRRERGGVLLIVGAGDIERLAERCAGEWGVRDGH